MNSPAHYRRLADDLRYRACLATSPVTRDQLKLAAQDYERLAQELEDERDTAMPPPTSER
jgi:hypothetical protein